MAVHRNCSSNVDHAARCDCGAAPNQTRFAVRIMVAGTGRLNGVTHKPWEADVEVWATDEWSARPIATALATFPMPLMGEFVEYEVTAC